MWNRFEIFTVYSWYYLPLCLLGGFFYAFLLYRKKPIWSRAWNYILAGLRGVLVAFLLFLFLEPFVKQILTLTEKPKVILLVDHSLSMKSFEKIQREWATAWKKEGDSKSNVDASVVDFDLKSLSGNDISWHTKTYTDITQAFQALENQYENQNLTDVLLVSDGIHNQGLSPLFKKYGFTVHTLLVGDTIPKMDLKVVSVFANKVAFIGNDFPVRVEVASQGLEGQASTVELWQENTLLAQQSIQITKAKQSFTFDFLVSAKQKGLQRLQIKVKALPKETNTTNNQGFAYVEVMDAKTKILLVAMAPHPDVFALSQIIKKNENIELVTYIPDIQPFKKDNYSLVIFHQVPNTLGLGHDVYFQLLKEKNALWHIAGPATDFSIFNIQNQVLKIETVSQQTDDASPKVNKSFGPFSLESPSQDRWPKFPPLHVPFGNIQLKNNAQVLFYQTIGATATEKPLMASAEVDGKKYGVLMGEGFWQWPMYEFNTTKNQSMNQEWVTKWVQYLATTVDRRKLRVEPIMKAFAEGEKPSFRAEAYNALYEKLKGQKIELEIQSKAGKKYAYSFYTSDGPESFGTEALPEGVYQFKASSLINGVKEACEGEFFVKSQGLEQLNTTADAALMQQLAIQNQGKYYTIANANNFWKDWEKKPVPAKVYAKEDSTPLWNQWPWMAVLFVLVSLEWFVRKLLGGY